MKRVRHKQKFNNINFDFCIGETIEVVWDDKYKNTETIKEVINNEYGIQLIFDREHLIYMPNYIEYIWHGPKPFWSCATIKNKKLRYVSKGDF